MMQEEGMSLMKEKEVKNFVKDRYGKIAKSGTSCCSSSASLTEQAKLVGYSEEDIKNVPEESKMGLGCGNPVALAGLKEGEIVLDLGSGGGIDVFLASKKVGSKGRVIGVDMTKKMIKRSEQTAEKYGYNNVEFRLGEIEDLPVEDNSVDVIISNCVINLSPNKKKVFREAYRVLKPKGRMLISDMVTEGELPSEIRKNLDAWAACIAGAMDKKEYLKTIEEVGFKKVKIVSESNYEVDVSKRLMGRITSIKVEAHKS
jgi:arsenite methyltransferase